MSELSKEKAAQCKQVFDLFDIDKDGCITTNTLESICQGLGAYVPSEDMQDYIKECKEGKINFEQFVKFFTLHYTRKLDKKQLLAHFEFLDKEKKGVIKGSELKHALMVLGDTLTEKEADDLIGKFIGKDGNIDYKEMTTELAK